MLDHQRKTRGNVDDTGYDGKLVAEEQGPVIRRPRPPGIRVCGEILAVRGETGLLS